VTHFRRFLLSEEATAFQWNLHRFEVVLVGHSNTGRQALAGWPLRTSIDFDECRGVGRSKGKKTDRPDCFDSGKSLHAGSRLAEEVYDLAIVVVAASWQIQTHRQDIASIETGVNRLQSREASNEQPAANKKYEREGDFDNHQRIAYSTAATACTAASALLEGILEVDSDAFPRRREPEDNACKKRDCQSKS